MSHASIEPVRPHGIHIQHLTGGHETPPTSQPASHTRGGSGHPVNIDALIAIVQREFPQAAIRITARSRTIEGQAELMADRIRHNRTQFLHTYLPHPHITEMDHWVVAHPMATPGDTTAAFTDIIQRARVRGAIVSNHLTDRARDISIPHGSHHLQQQVRQRLRDLGGHVIDEHDAVTGPHWHVDY